MSSLPRQVYAAFTGPGGGLASVNCVAPTLNIGDQDVDYIDDDDSLPDDQPNAYVTCQRPPPRKSPFSDMAEYFRRPSQHIKPDINKMQQYRQNKNNNIVVCEDCIHEKDRTGIKSSEDEYRNSLECVVPAWRGEAPSPLSPHPCRAPDNAFLQFGDNPLSYELTVAPASQSVVMTTNSRSCENMCSGDSSSSLCSAASLASLEIISTAPHNITQLHDTCSLPSPSSPATSSLHPLSSSLPTSSHLASFMDHNDNAPSQFSPVRTQSGSSSLTEGSLGTDVRLSFKSPEHKSCSLMPLQQKLLQQAIANKTSHYRAASCGNVLNNNLNSNDTSNNNDVKTDLTNEGGLIAHRAKFLTLDLVEGSTLSGQYHTLLLIYSHLYVLLLASSFLLNQLLQ